MTGCALTEGPLVPQSCRPAALRCMLCSRDKHKVQSASVLADGVLSVSLKWMGTVGMVRHWHGLPRETVVVSSFRVRLDGALINLT